MSSKGEIKTSDPGAFIYSLDKDLQRFMTKKLPAWIPGGKLLVKVNKQVCLDL